MNAAKQSAWGFCLLIILSCSGWYYASSSSPEKLDDHTLSKIPDSIIKGLKVWQFDSKGALAHFLESPQAKHIPENNTYIFDTPHIVLSQENESNWDIHSQKALALDKGKQINLVGNVIIHQGKGLKNSESTLKTEELIYFPEQKFATTTLAVMFEQPGSIIHSQGMNAYLDEKRVELLNKAHATYEPNHV
ncbi:LPS export ABC transporter periplasmic protein LptC [Legionella gresilensis]|uniref:LPS export ABC transporter periplasmic protein LptC n=1 Tax=Legionella gresilensis TaxID=91823 RepID=UPI001041A739|nr:LPS export ABC transporter periplasmic protein LptC [Legionella gresilensis]